MRRRRAPKSIRRSKKERAVDPRQADFAEVNAAKAAREELGKLFDFPNDDTNRSSAPSWCPAGYVETLEALKNERYEQLIEQGHTNPGSDPVLGFLFERRSAFNEKVEPIRGWGGDDVDDGWHDPALMHLTDAEYWTVRTRNDLQAFLIEKRMEHRARGQSPEP